MRNSALEAVQAGWKPSAARKITPDTRVVVQRTVTVSTEWTVAELAEMTGEDPHNLANVIGFGQGDTWLAHEHVTEMVPEFDRASTAEHGDVLDADVWRVVTR